MQELAGRLTALDPEATESLRVIAYFDALVAGGAGMESIARAAAVLSGVAAGVTREPSLRVRPDGVRAREAGEPGAWPHARTPAGPLVWIEREGPAHANDAMILERFALSAAIVASTGQVSPAGALEALIDPQRPDAERSRLADRLRLDRRHPLRIAALPADAAEPVGGPSAVILTARGAARILLLPVDAVVAMGPAGIADVPVEDAPSGWGDALTALRLASGNEVVHAADYGVLRMLWGDAHAAAHPDVAALAALDESLRILDAVSETESIRAASARLGMHHSSVQERHAHLRDRLGYDPREPLGRARYCAARMLMRLSEEGAPPR
ncbi:MAG: hypothetical protein NT132_11110 [Microbacterium sp.]|uniref:hypothetical protein n=1 Tax=Microbacterium sp. TaxID=51671 RepID=UPI002612981D|nr:hypothetical protein [Microbacterium sp.]MCX6502931.1 hypothetical protein [Microbacterium sp.]